jgi:hypothetical protein
MRFKGYFSNNLGGTLKRDKMRENARPIAGRAEDYRHRLRCLAARVQPKANVAASSQLLMLWGSIMAVPS